MNIKLFFVQMTCQSHQESLTFNQEALSSLRPRHPHTHLYRPATSNNLWLDRYTRLSLCVFLSITHTQFWCLLLALGLQIRRSPIFGFGLPWWLSDKETARKAGNGCLISGSGRFPRRREWLPTPVFWPGESHEQRSLVGHSSWDRNESDVTWRLSNSNNLCGLNVLDLTAVSTVFSFPFQWGTAD